MRLCFDIETNGLLEDLTCVHIIVAQDIDTGEIHDFKPHEIEAGLDLLSKADVLVAHNGIKFDIPALKKVYPDFTYKARVFDTLVLSRLIWPDLSDRDQINTAKNKYRFDKPKLIGSHSLAAWGIRLDEHKGDYEGGWEEWSEEMHSYAIQDVAVTLSLWKRIEKTGYSQTAIDLELEVADIMAECERHGFSFDVPAARVLETSLTREQYNLTEKLQDTFPPFYIKGPVVTSKRTVNYKDKAGTWEGGEYTKVTRTVFNPGSRVHIANRLKEFHGWNPSEFTASGLPKIDETVLSALPFPEAALLNDYFCVSKRLGQLSGGKSAWLNAERNGRIHGSYITNGAVTGRATHQNPNIAQVPSVSAPWGKECRSLFKAGDNCVLVGADLSGLELRCLSHYMSRYDDGAYAREVLQGDCHTANQAAAGLSTRDQAKTFIYAFLYGAGAEKIGSIVGGSAKDGKRLKNRFLKQTPALAHLIQDVSERASSEGQLRGLDGRLVHVRHQHAALNTLLQSAGALISKRWLVEIRLALIEAGLAECVNLVAWVHDEVQIEVNLNVRSTNSSHRGPDDTCERVKRIACDAARKAGEFFEFRVPIDAEATSGHSWADTH